MINIIDSIKKVDVENKTFPLINGVKQAKISENVLEGMKNFYQNTKNIQTKNLNKNEYRERIKQVYEKLIGIKPIDNINNTIYSLNYLEKGLTINKSINSIKQIWIEYRLIYNEHNKNKKEYQNFQAINERKIDKYMENKESYVLSNFDEIFDKLSQKVDGTSKYVVELKNMQAKVANNNTLLENNKKLLDQERIAFEKYLKEEKTKLEKEKEEFEAIKKAQDLKITKEKEKLDKNYKRLQELTEKFNEQVNKLIDK